MKKSTRRRKIKGTIYCFINKINGHKYVGSTKNKLEIRLNTHFNLTYSGAPLLVKALKKYGKDAFEIKIIDTAKTIGELHDKEIFWVKNLNCKAPNGYNLTDGGFTNEGAIEALREPVKCITNNKTYPSSAEASEDTGVAAYLIGFNCRGRQDTAGGMVFQFVNEIKKIDGDTCRKERKIKSDKNIIKIKNINTGDIYFSLTSAQQATGINRNIIQLCASGKMNSSKGIGFEYLDLAKKEIANKNKEKRIKNTENRRKSRKQILLLDTGQIFYGISEASKSTGAHQGAIYAVCMGKNDTANGLRFEYLNNGVKKLAKQNRSKRKKIRDKANNKKVSLMSKTMSKPVFCKELNKSFKSITEAVKLTGVSEGTINRSLKRQKPCEAGLTFVLIKKEV